jgi:hypothetical protein
VHSPGPGWDGRQGQRLDHLSLTSLHGRALSPQATTPFSSIGMPRVWTYWTTEAWDVRPVLNSSWTLDIATPGDGRIARSSRTQRLPCGVADQQRSRDSREGARGCGGRDEEEMAPAAETGGEGCVSHQRWMRWRYSYLIRRSPRMRRCWTRMTGLIARCRRLVTSISLGMSAEERVWAKASGIASSSADRGEGWPRRDCARGEGMMPRYARSFALSRATLGCDRTDEPLPR